MERLVSLLASLILILIGGTGILTWLGFFGSEDRPILRAMKSWVYQSSSAFDGPLMVVGYILILLVGLWLASLALSRSPSGDVVIMETSEGQVEVSLDALGDVIVSLRNEIAGIRSVTPEIAHDEDGVNIRVNLEIAGNVNVPDIVEQFKQKLRSELSDVFRIKNLETISVRIQNMSDYKAGSGSTVTSREAEPDEPKQSET